jgi:hypothetical protein
MSLISVNVKQVILKEINKLEAIKKTSKEYSKNYNKDCTKEIEEYDACINNYKKILAVDEKQ